MTQPAFTWSKLIIEPPEQSVKYVQSKIKDKVLVSLLLILNIFHTLF